MQRPKLYIYGAGELGLRVLQRWCERGGEARGYTATTTRHEQIRVAGGEAKVGSPADDLSADDYLLISLPGNRAQHQAVQTLVNTRCARSVFVSSTGFFGKPSGIVNEQTPAGDSEHAKNIAHAEHAFRQWVGNRGSVIRLGGLYRPDRGPMSALIRRGYPPPGPGDRTLGLIHYDDAAQGIVNAFETSELETLYVGVTVPCPSREAFYQLACASAGLPPPTFDQVFGKPLAQYDTARWQTLVPEPRYPDWRAATNTTEKSG
ncbi:MAG: hypothetical protein AAF493_07530 [Pseudomonadota bacterium]